MHQARIFISGRVQGVGFRAFVKYRARKLQLTGWVQNLPDGRVEAVVQGEKPRLEMIIQDCNKGSYIAEVKDVQFIWEDPTEEFSDFTIHRLS